MRIASLPTPALTIAPPPRPTQPASLQDLYDRRATELAEKEQLLTAKEAQAAKAQKWAIGGAATTLAGLGLSVASSFLRNSGSHPALIGTAVGLTAVGLAIYAPALWIRDSASMDAWMLRSEVPMLQQSQESLQELMAERAAKQAQS